MTRSEVAPLDINGQTTMSLGLADSLALSVPVVGGKFASLCRLFKAGINVPQGVCLTTDAYSLMIDAIGCSTLVNDLIISHSNRRYYQSLEIVNKIGNTIRSATIPTAIRHNLFSSLSDLAYPLIIRSSATNEDSSSRSFAGIFDSILAVNSLDEAYEAVKACWASLFSEKVVAYCKSDASFFQSSRMAVICQQMLTPSVGGVAFTQDPLKSTPIFTINASWGLPSLLVSGEIVPDLFELGENGVILQRKLGSKRSVSEYVDGVLQTRSATPLERHSYSLFDNQLREIYQCGKRIESVFGSPQDIEWAFQGDRLYVLQSRAITTSPGDHNVS